MQHAMPELVSSAQSTFTQRDARSEAIVKAIESVEAKDRNILEFINKVCCVSKAA